ncbi:MAG TPA: enoyl-CoA hydratase-related protein [Noviherbaspirillum sp.]|uniref:enoyl-CoA hydratase/isomerase family protein n=1 Tax=Noviherbaspirillum sp. TaxID=1926288 RepID=UPI002D3CA841|nr:enoyl-CoA hydratase-related protein [Noviherbaspirillum sp.]HYD93830.1 enoyl-CoA hydratase-related protein [Noviherbaspirillum sp.]
MTTRLSIDGGLATVVFDNPATLNAMGREQIAELNRVTQQVAAVPGVRVVLLRSEGPAFGVGGDLASLRPDRVDAPAVLREIGRDLNPAILRLRELPAIVVAAVHGAVAGGSMGLVCVADLVIAAKDTKFNLAYARIGASPDAGNSWFLPRLVGPRKALEWLLLSDNFDADTALAYGVVNQVVPADGLRAATDALVARLLAGPHGSHARMKRLVYQAETTPLARQLDDEIENFAQAAASPDLAEGIAAFIEKRPPRFGKT